MGRPKFLEPGVSGSSSLWSKIFVLHFLFFFKIEDLEILFHLESLPWGFYLGIVPKGFYLGIHVVPYLLGYYTQLAYASETSQSFLPIKL